MFCLRLCIVSLLFFQIIDHSLNYLYLLALFDQFASMGITQSDLKVIKKK